ncbi:MAG: hypothetical protein CL910_16155 [Deltaproteobacteria bacterium]|nr:hypothetical protein [Deltaproteobacteria bacterium]
MMRLSKQRFDKVRAATLALFLAFALGGAAQASPVDLFFGNFVPSFGGDFGLSPQSVADFRAAGGREIANPGLMMYNSGEFVDVDTPDNLPVGLPMPPCGPDYVASPCGSSNDWAFTPGTQPATDLWIVFMTHSPDDPRHVDNWGGSGAGYAAQNVGLNVDAMDPNWAIVLGAPGGGPDPDVYYLARYIGDVSPGAMLPDLPIDYRLRQPFLTPGGGIFWVPQYRLALMSAPVPEAGTLLLLGVAGLAWAARRARC